MTLSSRLGIEQKKQDIASRVCSGVLSRQHAVLVASRTSPAHQVSSLAWLHFLGRHRCCDGFVDNRPDRSDAPSAFSVAAQSAVHLGHTRRNVGRVLCDGANVLIAQDIARANNHAVRAPDTTNTSAAHMKSKAGRLWAGPFLRRCVLMETRRTLAMRGPRHPGQRPTSTLR